MAFDSFGGLGAVEVGAKMLFNGGHGMKPGDMGGAARGVAVFSFSCVGRMGEVEKEQESWMEARGSRRRRERMKAAE